MRELPILFSTPMVQAIQENRKTMTRRLSGLEKVNECPEKWSKVFGATISGYFKFYCQTENRFDFETCKPRYQVGDQLWVKETFTIYRDAILYKATNSIFKGVKWKSSLFMRKEYARTWLECTGIRCERLQDISEADAIAEGIKLNSLFEQYECPVCGNGKHLGSHLICDDGFFSHAKDAFASLWHKINGFDSWVANPWVFIYEFKRIENEDKGFLKTISELKTDYDPFTMYNSFDKLNEINRTFSDIEKQERKELHKVIEVKLKQEYEHQLTYQISDAKLIGSKFIGVDHLENEMPWKHYTYFYHYSGVGHVGTYIGASKTSIQNKEEIIKQESEAFKLWCAENEKTPINFYVIFDL